MILRQGVLHLPEAVVVQFRGVDMAADQLRGIRFAQVHGASDCTVGVVGVIDGNVDALVHISLRVDAQLQLSNSNSPVGIGSWSGN